MPQSDRRFLGSEWILGLNPGFGGFNYHDPSAALLRDGEVVCAAEEDRFTRRKGAAGDFPSSAVQFCLSHARIAIEDLSEIAIGYSPRRWQDRLGLEVARAGTTPGFQSMFERGRRGVPSERRGALQAITHMAASLTEILDRSQSWRDEATAAARVWRHLGLAEAPIPIRFVEHHPAHVASTWLPSGFNEATIVIFDGVGEVTCASAWTVRDNDFRTLAPLTEICVPNSLGYLYAALTEYLGFGAWSGEGKLMALAPYGAFDKEIDRRLGSIARISDRRYDVSEFILANLGDGLSLDLDRVCASLAAVFGEPPRRASNPVSPVYKNIAWAAQNFLEEAVVAFARKAIDESCIRNLCVAGGVFLNCKLNMVLRETFGADRFYVQPVSRDSGLAIGSAWYRHLQKSGAPSRTWQSLALGREFHGDEVQRLIDLYGLEFDLCDDIADRVAELLANGAIVGWFSGRSEYGPRALGQRSIVADPRDPAMRERMNEKVKNREVWRPFGPSILEEHAASILEGFLPAGSAPFMIEAYRVREAWRSRIPAAIHPADGTTRPHTVRREVNPSYYRMIECFHDRTGIPAVLNTSLNDRGEPIVDAPRDAIRFFYASGMDALALGNRLLYKRGVKGFSHCQERLSTTLPAPLSS